MKLSILIAASMLLVAACGNPLAATLDDDSGSVDDWAVDLLGSFGIQSPAGDLPLPAVVWVDDDRQTVVIAYQAAPCRQYPQVAITGSLDDLTVTIDPKNDGSPSCGGSEALWGLGLVLEAPITADDITVGIER